MDYPIIKLSDLSPQYLIGKVLEIPKATSYIGQKLLRNQIFYASSPEFKANLDADRLQKSRDTLSRIGAEFLYENAPRNTKLELCYCTAESFKNSIVKMGGQFSYNNPISKDSPILILHNYVLKNFFITNGINVCSDGIFNSEFISLPKHKISTEEVGSDNKTAAILTHGNSSIIERDRSRFIKTLLMGMDVVSVNIRGTGQSSDIISEDTTYEDLETVLTFLYKRGYQPQNIQVFGYCLGGGASTYLAAKHPIHLVLDRSFCKIGDIIAEDALEMAGFTQNSNANFTTNYLLSITKQILSFSISIFIINYNNKSNIEQKTEGSICLLSATQDHVIPHGSAEKMWVKASKEHTSFIEMNCDHNSSWPEEAMNDFFEHQNKYNLIRSFGMTENPGNWAIHLVNDFVNKSVNSASKPSALSSSKTG